MGGHFHGAIKLLVGDSDEYAEVCTLQPTEKRAPQWAYRRSVFAVFRRALPGTWKKVFPVTTRKATSLYIVFEGESEAVCGSMHSTRLGTGRGDFLGAGGLSTLIEQMMTVSDRYRGTVLSW